MAYYTIDQNIGDVGNALSHQKIIALMMHGFGDSSTPNPSTVALVESITLQQMHGIISEAMKNMEKRNATKLISEDIFFLMRYNKGKLKRLLNYYKMIDNFKDKSKVLGEQSIPKILMEDDDVTSKKKRKSVISKVLSLLDETDDIQYEINVDPTLHERNLRILKMADGLSVDKYLAFNAARNANFLKSCSSTKLVTKFKQWLNLDGGLSVKADSLLILNYLARETVATIVDLAFLVRQDSRRVFGDPLSTLDGGNYCNPMSLANSVYVKTGQEGVSPLTVCEVREAMRRFSTQRIGIAGLFVRDMKKSSKLKFLAM